MTLTLLAGLSAALFFACTALLFALRRAQIYQMQAQATLQASAANAANEMLQATRELLQSQSVLTHEVSEKLSQGSRELANQVDETLSHTRREMREALFANTSHIGEKLEENLLAAERQLSHMSDVSFALGELKNVLHLPHLRGRLLGERSLERLLADFLPAGYFQMQYSIEGKYVDAVIKYPHLNVVLPIDSKFSFEQVAALYEDHENEASLKAARKKLGEIAKQNAREIKSKYIKPELGTTDYALMYLPSETLYFEVVRDTELWKTLAELKVFAVSPNTLAVTVHAVSQSLKYYEMSCGVENTLKQVRAAQQSLEKFKMQFDDVGVALARVQTAFVGAHAGFGKYSAVLEKLEAHTASSESKGKDTEAAELPVHSPPVEQGPLRKEASWL